MEGALVFDSPSAVYVTGKITPYVTLARTGLVKVTQKVEIDEIYERVKIIWIFFLYFVVSVVTLLSKCLIHNMYAYTHKMLF